MTSKHNKQSLELLGFEPKQAGSWAVAAAASAMTAIATTTTAAAAAATRS